MEFYPPGPETSRLYTSASRIRANFMSHKVPAPVPYPQTCTEQHPLRRKLHSLHIQLTDSIKKITYQKTSQKLP